MRAKLSVVTVVLLLLPGVAMADGCGGVFGLSVEYGDQGDDGDGLGGGVRFVVPAGSGALQLAATVNDGESVAEITVNGAPQSHSLVVIRQDTTIWSASANFVRNVERRGQDGELFYGGGVGWYKVEGEGFEDDSIGGQILGGITFGCDYFFELRYVFGTEFDWGGGVMSDVDGVRFCIGRWLR